MSMSIGLVLLAATQAAPAAPSQAVEDELVVLGRRMREVRLDFQVRKGKLRRCRITQSSGDAAVDRLVCDTARLCAAERPKSTDAMKTCIERRRDSMLEEKAAARARQWNDDHARD